MQTSLSQTWDKLLSQRLSQLRPQTLGTHKVSGHTRLMALWRPTVTTVPTGSPATRAPIKLPKAIDVAYAEGMGAVLRGMREARRSLRAHPPQTDPLSRWTHRVCGVEAPCQPLTANDSLARLMRTALTRNRQRNGSNPAFFQRVQSRCNPFRVSNSLVVFAISIFWGVSEATQHGEGSLAMAGMTTDCLSVSPFGTTDEASPLRS